MKNKTFIVSEIGVNHSGNLETAKQLIRYSKWAGADAVKFQTWHKDTFPDLKHLYFNDYQHEHLKEYCECIGIKWFSTPFDLYSVGFLKSLGMTIWKIPSNRAVLDNKEMLEAIGKIHKKLLIVSTGASDYSEICDLPEVLSQNYKTADNFVYLHCVSKYPTEPKDAKLEMITYYQAHLPFGGGRIGLSDHSATISIPVAAVALGATVIEKHITLDRNSEGPDHKSSIEPSEFKEMVKMIRETEVARG